MRVQQGDCLGVIAPASPIDAAVFRRGLDYLHSCGFKTKVVLEPAKSFTTGEFLFSSDTARARVAALYDLFEDNTVRAVLSARGGYGSMELLPLLDLKRLSRNPKPFVGLSDVTPFLNLLAQRTRIPAVHGVVFPKGFAKAETDPVSRMSCEDLFGLLAGRRETVWSEDTRFIGEPGEFEGAIIGGNMTLLAAVNGTEWEPAYDDQVLFLEEVGEKPYRIHRVLYQLKLAGHLKKLKGVVIGEMLNCNPEEGTGITVDRVFEDIFGEYDYPVVAGAPFGHGEKNFAFQLGSKVTVSYGSITITTPD